MNNYISEFEIVELNIDTFVCEIELWYYDEDSIFFYIKIKFIEWLKINIKYFRSDAKWTFVSVENKKVQFEPKIIMQIKFLYSFILT